MRGGYRATQRNLEYLRKWRRGESIGFTMTASLKAKGLIPRTSKALRGPPGGSQRAASHRQLERQPANSQPEPLSAAREFRREQPGTPGPIREQARLCEGAKCSDRNTAGLQ